MEPLYLLHQYLPSDSKTCIALKVPCPSGRADSTPAPGTRSSRTNFDRCEEALRDCYRPVHITNAPLTLLGTAQITNRTIEFRPNSRDVARWLARPPFSQSAIRDHNNRVRKQNFRRECRKPGRRLSRSCTSDLLEARGCARARLKI